MRQFLAPTDRLIADRAGKQHGVITSEQLRELRLDHSAIRRRVRAGRLHRIFRGVYAVGHASVGHLGLWMAATLALGPSAVLSHISAAMLWETLALDESRVPHVTLPHEGGRRRRKRLLVHRSRTLTPDMCRVVKGIPVTSPRRTLDDLRTSEPTWRTRKATRQAEYLGLDLDGLETDGTRGPLEADYLEFFAEIGIPPPEVNAPIGRFNVDFSWPGDLFAIETDAITGHRGAEQMESDAALGLELARHGYELVRLTERQLKEERRAIAQLLRRRLGTELGRETVE